MKEFLIPDKEQLTSTYVHTKRVSSYLIGRTLGQGSFAKVKEAMHLMTGQKVAIKIIDKKKAKEDAYVRRNLRREGRLLQKLCHPNIVALYEVLETQKTYYLVTELCSGGDLMGRICAFKRLPEEEAKVYLAQVISAIEYMHRAGIVHRDLKVENLLLDQHNKIKLIDFGLSNSRVDRGGGLSTQCGSPAYAAPELLDNQKYDHRVDIWSIGVNMFAMLTGNLPFTVQPFNLKNLYNKMIAGEMNKMPDDLSAECKDLLFKFLMSDLETRITLKEAIQHKWISTSYHLKEVKYPNEEGKLDMRIVDHMCERLNFDLTKVVSMVTKHQPSCYLATYQLLQNFNQSTTTDRRSPEFISLVETDEPISVDERNSGKPLRQSKSRLNDRKKENCGEITDVVLLKKRSASKRILNLNVDVKKEVRCRDSLDPCTNEKQKNYPMPDTRNQKLFNRKDFLNCSALISPDTRNSAHSDAIRTEKCDTRNAKAPEKSKIFDVDGRDGRGTNNDSCNKNSASFDPSLSSDRYLTYTNDANSDGEPDKIECKEMEEALFIKKRIRSPIKATVSRRGNLASDTLIKPEIDRSIKRAYDPLIKSDSHRTARKPTNQIIKSDSAQTADKPSNLLINLDINQSVNNIRNRMKPGFVVPEKNKSRRFATRDGEWSTPPRNIGNVKSKTFVLPNSRTICPTLDDARSKLMKRLSTCAANRRLHGDKGEGRTFPKVIEMFVGQPTGSAD